MRERGDKFGDENNWRELVRTNDAVLVSAVGALLDAAHIPHVVLDQNMSVLEGSIGILPRRILVSQSCIDDARALLEDAGLDTSFARMSAEVTEDAVLGGKLRLKQPSGGHRVGHDAILLAAACPARAGERVVDLGAGVGAAGLALARRVDGARVVLVEIDAALAALAAENAQLNGLGARVSAVALDVAAPARAFAAAGLAPESVTRILMNPPFNDPARQRASPDRQRRLAHAGSGETLRAWIKTAARLLRPRGTLSVICRADRLAELLQALAPAFGAATVLPVYPGERQPAVRVLVRATKASRGPLMLLPGFLLNDPSGRPTAQAEAVLRGNGVLPLTKS